MKLNPYLTRHLVMFGAAVALSCGIGVATNITTYSADGDMGVYVSGLGIEHGHADIGIDVWLCADSAWVPDWRCPGYQAPSIRVRHRAPAVPTRDGWVPITLDVAMMLSDYSDREDWSGCETTGTVPLRARCADGYTLEIR